MTIDSKRKHLVITAAGTGGHVMPGLAVAREMMRRGWQVTWIGTQTGMEGNLVAKDSIDFIGLDFRGVRGKGLLGSLEGLWKLRLASRRCRKLIGELKPDVVFTTGGYVAVPVTAGVKKYNSKLVVMNCDADLLMSTHMIVKQAWGLACGFAGSARSYAPTIAKITGNPVRADIEAIEPPEERLAGREGRLHLLVFGGSLGAKVLNETLPRALSLFDEDKRPEVIHQCGAKAVDEVKALYEAQGVKAEVVGFIDDMASAYRWCDLVVCRAGATSVSELCAAGVASVLVPFIAKTTQHQRGNAKYMAGNGASVMIEQSHLTPEYLFGVLSSMKRSKILDLSKKARQISRKNATGSVCDMIESVDRMKKKP